MMFCYFADCAGIKISLLPPCGNKNHFIHQEKNKCIKTKVDGH